MDHKTIWKEFVMSIDGDESMSDVSDHMLLRDLLVTSYRDKENEMQLSFTDEIGVLGTPEKSIPNELYAIMDRCLDLEEMSVLSPVKGCKRFNASPSIIDLTNSDLNRRDYSIEDSDGTAVVMNVESDLVKRANERTRAFMKTLPIVEGHEHNDDDVKEYFPITDKSGKLTGMSFTSLHGKTLIRNGRPCMRQFVWVDFMDRLNSEENHYPAFDRNGFMIGIHSIPKIARNLGPSFSEKKQKKILEYFEVKNQH
jgi:hypothetical protein